MKTTIVVTLLCLWLQADVYSQTLDRPSVARLALGQTAEIPLGTFIGVQLGTSAFNSNTDVNRIIGTVEIAGIVEAELSNVGGLQTMLYELKRQPSLGLKLKLLSEGDGVPAIAISVKGSITWQNYWNSSDNMQLRRPDLYRAGLASAGYGYGYTTARILMTKHVWHDIMLDLAIGVDDVSTRNVSFWGGAPNYIFPGYYSRPSVHHAPTVQGYLGIVYPLTPELALMGESETIPFVTPDGNLSSLTTERAFIGSLGIRWQFTRWHSFDCSWFGVSNSEGIASSELRVGLNLVLPMFQ